MHIHSNSFEHRHTLAAEFALGAEHGQNVGGNRNPHLAWDAAPAATQSFALLCIDTDAPTDGGLVADSTTPIPVAHPRGDFVHWVVANSPADVHEVAAGSCSHGLTANGKPQGHDAGGLTGLNDYTGWFAGDAAMAGQYFGYDGPYPPPHDLRTHRYFSASLRWMWPRCHCRPHLPPQMCCVPCAGMSWTRRRSTPLTASIVEELPHPPLAPSPRLAGRRKRQARLPAPPHKI